MSIYSGESRAQRWRAIAELNDHQPALITLAPSIVQLREMLPEAYYSVLAEEVQTQVRKVHIERFEGLSDKGYWKHCQTIMPSTIRRN